MEENLILGKGCKGLNITEFVNKMLDFDKNDRAKLRKTVETYGMDLLAITIKPNAEDVPRRYDITVVYGMGIKEGDTKLLYCETKSIFAVDLQREIQTMDDAPIDGLIMLACEAAGSTRAYMQSITPGEPFNGFLLGLGWGLFPFEAENSSRRFLSSKNQKG